MADQSVPNYKDTVLLPQTEFPMKGNLPTKEPELVQFWLKNKIHQKVLEKNKSGQKFTLPDGPPYANGSIHIGHALNKTLKDIIIKYKNFNGFHAPFIPGWDCHGLPIEHAILKSLGAKAKEKTNLELRSLCRAEAQKWVDHQRPQFQRLGVLADWDHPYKTMDREYEAEEVREFARAFSKGFVYVGVKPVYWNWTLQTALADAEVEYHPHKSPAIYVAFDVTDAESLKKLKIPSARFVIWTTTPWTLPANVGICLNPEFEYGSYKSEHGNLIIAVSLKESFEKETGLTLTLLEKYSGQSLELLKAQHPFIERDSIVVLGDHVTAEAGTGCVHTAPGHGADDFKVGKLYGLKVLSPVNEVGQFTDEVPEYKGINIFKANPLIIERLKNSGHLLGHKEIEHSYPHCWRSKTPLIFRATPQWFFGLDIEGNSARKLALEEISKVEFFPKWGEARFRGMMETRPDWCLSRQRVWGVPIPVYNCIKTHKILADTRLMMALADEMEQKNGLESFFETSAADLLKSLGAEVTQDILSQHRALYGSEFGTEGFKPGTDIFDVWFDSGICHAAVQKKRAGLSFPADLYLEGSDQHRGWFNTSLLSSVLTNGKAPFKSLITHGFVNDANGFKMSKSKGNTIDPNEVAAKNGAEIIRLWSVYEDYGGDMNCGQTSFDRVTETYRRIRNTMRFLLGATFDFNPNTDSVDAKKWSRLDTWAYNQLNELTGKVTEAYEEYSFNKVYHLLNQFFTIELSAVYLDILKDRLYTWKKDGVERRSSQTVLYKMLIDLNTMMAPILSFLSEEVHSHLKFKTTESVFLNEFPKFNANTNKQIDEDFKKLLEVRKEAQRVMEPLRAQKIIGSSLEAHLEIEAPQETLQVLEQYHQKGNLKSELREIFIVSSLQLKLGSAVLISATKAAGEKCSRCWIYSDNNNSSSQFPEVCAKCVEALTT